MRLGVLGETAAHERRVALAPPTVQKLRAAGHEISVETGAGEAAGYPDASYRDAGASVVDRSVALTGCEILLTVQCPEAEDMAHVPPGTVVIGLAQRTGANRFL